MTIKTFSEDEISKLKLHPYVVDVTPRFVYFSVEFKQHFFTEYNKGKKPRRIITEMDLDPEILGQTRINGIKRHVMEEAQRGCGFTDMQYSLFRDKPKNPTAAGKIKRLEHDLAYAKQELEFLKKILYANREAQEE